MMTRDELIERYERKAAVNRVAMEAATTSQERGASSRRANQAAKRANELRELVVVPNEFWRERYLALAEAGRVTLSDLAVALGYENRGKPDTSHVQRVLGLRAWSNKKGYPPIWTDTIPYDTAAKLADVLDVPRWEIEDPDPAYTIRPRFRRFERAGCDFKGCDEPVADPSLPRFEDDSCRGGMCETHAPYFARLRAEFKVDTKRRKYRGLNDRLYHQDFDAAPVAA